MASLAAFQGCPRLLTNSEYYRPSFRVRALSSDGGGDSTVLADSVAVNGASSFVREKNGTLIDVGNGRLKHGVVKERKLVKEVVSKELQVLWEDGYGTNSVKDYLDAAKEIIKPDGGPPRWFCPVECGCPLKDSPTLLFLPGNFFALTKGDELALFSIPPIGRLGLDGLGLGLILHHKPLGKAFEVRCLHIPVRDRTPFDGLVKFVEQTVRSEHASSPNKPIYLVGDSFGGCLALAVAARNPSIDLVLVLANPATSFGRSQLQPLFPFLEALPDQLHVTVPYLLTFVMGDPMKMAMVNIDSRLPSRQRLEQISSNLTALLPRLSGMADIIPKDTFLWKLKLLKSASAYANSRLHAVKAEVLVLASGKDNMLPSGDEAKRLKNTLQNCIVRYFKDNGHTLLLEEGLSLLTIMKGTGIYRRSKKSDPVSDFLPPSMTEYKYAFDQVVGLLRFATSSVMLSTLEDGKIVKGLAGVPSEGPVLLVGYHMLMGVELQALVEAFLREKNIMVRGIAHPILFSRRLEHASTEFSMKDWIQVMGGVPVSGKVLYKLFSTKSHILLYPGGAREALHYKGEEYKLIWPNQQEFVRMAARFGATIVPFGAVGEDDIAELVLDYDDLMRIPLVNDYIRDNSDGINIRDEINGEVANQRLFVPGLLPKVPGRLYYLFGKPIQTKGKQDLLKDKQNANQVYLQVKSEVESCIAYLLNKREEDPYRNIIDRTIYHATYGGEAPTFKL